MAYGTKYRFTFDSFRGVEHKILILQDGYSGNVIDRRLGRSPILKRQKNGPICGTSLELFAECNVDGEFAEFFSAGALDYKVELYRGYILVWEGFITPELYSEPSIAPPYDVQIIATDGLGELKLHDFQAMGLVTIRELLLAILEKAMPEPYISVFSHLHEAATGEDEQDFLELQINMDFMAGESYYDVLACLLDSLHMTISRMGIDWVLSRETDIVVNSSGGIEDIVRITAPGSTYVYSLPGCSKTVGQMGVADLWPVGYLSTKIEPAKKSVRVQMPWRLSNILDNPGMSTDTAWTKDNAVFNAYSKGGYWVGESPSAFTRFGRIYQWHSVGQMQMAMKVMARVYCYGDQSSNPRIACYLQFTPDGGGQNLYYYSNSWTQTAPTESTIKYTTPGYNDYYLHASAEAATEYEWDFPPIPNGNVSGQLCIVFCGDVVVLYGAELIVNPYNKGYEDTIKIDNDARGDAGDVEIIGGRFQSGVLFSTDAYQGVFVNSSGAAYLFTDHLFTSKDFLSITALGYAESVALPRMRTEGILDVPASLSELPLLIRTTQGSTDIDSWIETFEWDILNDELTISALSLPVAQLTVESEVVTEITSGSGGSSSGSGGGGGGGGTTGVTSVDITVPTGFEVSGNPITSSGTLAVTFASGYSLPTTQKQTQWDSAYNNKHSHSNKTVLDGITSTKVGNWDTAYTDSHTHSNKTVLDGISSTDVGNWNGAAQDAHTHGNKSVLDGITSQRVSAWDAAAAGESGFGAQAPRLYVRHGINTSGTAYDMVEVLHPNLGQTGYEAVLMVYRGRNGRKTYLSPANHWKYKRGWAVALGDYHLTGHVALTAAGNTQKGGRATFSFTDLRNFIIKRFMVWVGYTQAQLYAMDYTTWNASNDTQRGFKRMFKDSYGKCFMRFGIAVRYENPAFAAELVSGHTLKVTTNEINGVPRYIYSAVAPLGAFLIPLRWGDRNFRKVMTFGVLEK